MQDKWVYDDPDFQTKELQNYAYQVINPKPADLNGVHWEYVDQEWEDRLVGDRNPGKSWKTREEVWREFLEVDLGEGGGRSPSRFAYTYSQRMGGKKIQQLIDDLTRRPNSRQMWLPVWWPIDNDRRGEQRVPCSLGYWFVRRAGRLNVTYMMRSCDFITHWPIDVSLATMLMRYIADEVPDTKPGTFTQFIGSFHVYKKDVAGVF
jgi:thymidylate synthase